VPRGYKLTVRHGPDVEKEKFFSLDLAMSQLEKRAGEIMKEDRPETVQAVVREFTPEEQVVARFEVRGPKLLRGPRAGIDLKGDGEMVPYKGRMFRTELPGGDGHSAYEVIRQVLRSKRF
jgi:hypothetical protein